MHVLKVGNLKKIYDNNNNVIKDVDNILFVAKIGQFIVTLGAR